MCTLCVPPCCGRQSLFSPLLFLSRCPTAGSVSRGIGELLNDLRSIPKTGDAPNLIMVVGFPNVGKSSLINKMKLASRGRAAVGAAPGVTRATTSFPLNPEGTVFVLDTPGQ